jgi:hypothetical protein
MLLSAFYYTYDLLNMFRAPLCPSSGAHDYVPLFTTFLDKFHVMYRAFRSGNLTYCLEGMDRLAWLIFLNSVARYVILSFISVYHMEGNMIGCIILMDITKVITTHWLSTEQLTVVVVTL